MKIRNKTDGAAQKAIDLPKSSQTTPAIHGRIDQPSKASA